MINNKLQKILLIIISFICIISPFILYINHFGATLSSNNSDWGNFGSFISGIYTPIISILTILILYKQLEQQNVFNKHEIENKHIQKSSDNILHHSKLLLSIIDNKSPKHDHTYRELLSLFSSADNKNELLSHNFFVIADEINLECPQIYSAWSSINSFLVGLNTPENINYESALLAEMSKLMSSLTFKTCAELENFQHSLTTKKIKTTTKYFFSPILYNELKEKDS
jgi:hypothetical protein